MNQIYMKWLAEQICLPKETAQPLTKYLEQHWMAVDSMTEQVHKNKGWITALQGEMQRRRGQDDRYLLALGVVMALSEDTLQRYRKKGIPDEIFIDTMQDITVWSNTCLKQFHLPGLENLGWIQNHLVPNLYRIGRLQYQFFNAYFPIYMPRKQRRQAPIRRKEPCIFIHIPEGIPLSETECSESIARANQFFAQYFSDYNYRYYITESWLLDPQNHNVLPADSNILKFGGRFEVLASIRDDRQAIERIFGERQADVEDYQEDTRLQSNVKAYIKNQGKMGIGFGILPK